MSGREIGLLTIVYEYASDNNAEQKIAKSLVESDCLGGVLARLPLLSRIRSENEW